MDGNFSACLALINAGALPGTPLPCPMRSEGTGSDDTWGRNLQMPWTITAARQCSTHS
jgi:hypothetical protein